MEKIKAKLSNRLYIRENDVQDWMREQFTYRIPKNAFEIAAEEAASDLDDGTDTHLTIQTYREYPNGWVGFPRGNIEKLNEVFGDCEISDERVLAPHGYDLKFNGVLKEEQSSVWKTWRSFGYGLVQAPPRWGKCVTGDSIIHTDSGLRYMDELFECPESSFTVHGSTDNQFATHKYKRVVNNVRTLVLRNGQEITGTPEHPVMVYDASDCTLKWMPLDSIRSTEHSVVVRKNIPFSEKDVLLKQPNATAFSKRSLVEKLPVKMDRNLAELMGYITSEGRIAGNVVTFCNKDADLLNRYRFLFQLCFGEDVRQTQTVGRDVISLVRTSAQLESFFRLNGLKMTSSYDAEVPWSVMQSSRDCMRAFLRAYFDGDGWFEENSIQVTSASHKLIKQIQIILLSFGVYSRVRCVFKTPHASKPKKPYFSLKITSDYINTFMQEVGFSLKHKHKYSTIPRKKSTCHALDGMTTRILGLKDQFPDIKFESFSNVFSHGKHRRLFKHNITSNLIKDVAQVDQLLAATLSYLARDEIITVDVDRLEERTGQFDVFDLTVPVEHNFCANGVVVHNTIFCAHAICKLKQRTLVLAQEWSLLEQFEEEMRKFTNVNELEELHGRKLVGCTEDASTVFPIATFSSWQSYINPKSYKKFLELRDYWGLVIVDEAHSSAAPCFSKVVGSTNAFYRLPVTATPERKDKKECVVFDVVGPVTAVGKTEQLPVRVHTWKTNFKPTINAGSQRLYWAKLRRRLAHSEERNKLIIDNVIRDVKNGHKVVLCTDLVAHIKTLQKMFRKAAPEYTSEVLFGDVSGNKRTELRLRAKAGEVDVVFAYSKIVQLGWNVWHWSSIHSVLPMSNRPNWEQRVARVRTPCPACPGVRSAACLTQPTCLKQHPECNLYVDELSTVQGCYITQRTVNRELGFPEEIHNVKVGEEDDDNFSVTPTGKGGALTISDLAGRNKIKKKRRGIRLGEEIPDDL